MSQHRLRARAAACAGLIVAFLAGPALAQAPLPNITNGRVFAIKREMGMTPQQVDALFPPRDEQKEELGKLLFFDKILSGNMNISCATCHHPLAATGDGLSLPIGEGGMGLGKTRDTGAGPDAVHERVPRNAPHIFNLGAEPFTVMFHDGRVAVDPSQPSGFLSPAGDDLPMGLDSVLAAQAMFPVTSGAEMAGQPGENSIADAAAADNLAGPGGVWEQLADRLKAIPEYVDLFTAAFDDIDSAADITYVHAANAIAAFEASAWRSTNSDFDAWIMGDNRALSKAEKKGMKLFYGAAGCSECHTGYFQTDNQFYAIAMPQVGPGKGDNADGYSDGRDDFGLERVTGDINDRYKFRTPTLRNVAMTAPYGHSGAYDTLEAVVEHHLDPIGSLNDYDKSNFVVPSRSDLDAEDFVVQDDPARRALIAQANELAPTELKDRDFEYLISFLYALTDRDFLDDRRNIPLTVPSGLPVAD